MASPIDNTDLRIVPGDPEPRFLDLRLAERLEFDRPRDIRKLIERNRDELELQAPLRHHGALVGRPQGGGTIATEYWLTIRQGMIISMRSDAPRAIDVRAELARLGEAVLQGKVAIVGSDLPTIAGTFRDLFNETVVPVIKEIRADIKAIVGNVTILAERGRRPATAETERLHAVIIRHDCLCRCPCGECTTIIMDDSGFIDGQWHHHHQFNRNDNRPEAMIPLAIECHQRLTTDPEFKVRFDSRAFPRFQYLLARMRPKQIPMILKMPGEE